MTTIATSKDAMAQARTRMEKAVEDFRKELAGVRTGRANVTLLIVNGASPAGLGLGGQGYLSYSIATPTGEGITTPLTFTRYRRVMITGSMRMI